MELFKTVPAYSWLFIYFRISIQLIEKLSRRHFINSSDVFVIEGFTVVYRALHVNFLIENKSSCEEVKSPF